MVLSSDYIKSLFNYQDGKLIRRITRSPNAKKGDCVGSLNGRGYLHVNIDGKFHYVHRLIFLYHNGYTPEVLDHIDGDKTNNNINNLRECSNMENSHNSKTPSHNKSGIKGVCWATRERKWMAYVKLNKKCSYFGLHSDIRDAEKAAIKGRMELHGDFANNGG